MPLPARAVGVSWRPELAAGLFAEPALVDVIEVVAERALWNSARRREARALAEVWPTVPHGVALSLGSVDGVERARVDALSKLAREVRAPYVSEHIAFVRAGGVEIGHLTQLPRTRAALHVVTKNIGRVSLRLPCPLLLENVAWSIRSRDDEMDEATFVSELVERTGCGLLLDVSNLRANARNEGLEPAAVLARYPLDAVRMMHVAGARTAADGFVFDTHADPLDDEVRKLLALALARTGPVPVVLERDRAFPPFAETRAELLELRAAVDCARAGHGARAAEAEPRQMRAAAAAPDALAALDALDAWQRRVARSLAGLEDGEGTLDPRELARARSILARKKLEEHAAAPRRATFSPRALIARVRHAVVGGLP